MTERPDSGFIGKEQFLGERQTRQEYLSQAFAFAESNLGSYQEQEMVPPPENYQQQRQALRTRMREATANFWQDRSLKDMLALQNLSQQEIADFLTERLKEQELEENGVYYQELMSYMTRGIKGKINFMLAKYLASDQQDQEIIGKQGQVLKGAARTIRAASLAREAKFNSEKISYAEIFRQRLEKRSNELKKELETQKITPSLLAKAGKFLGRHRRVIIRELAAGTLLGATLFFATDQAAEIIEKNFFSPIEVMAFSSEDGQNLTAEEIEELGLGVIVKETETVTPSPTSSPTSSPTPTATVTSTPTATITETATPSPTPSPTETALPTNTPSPTPIREKVPKPSPTLVMRLKQMLPIIFGAGKQQPEKVMPPEATSTPIPATETATSTPTLFILEPTNTPSPTPSPTPMPTETATTPPSPTPEIPITTVSNQEIILPNPDSYVSRAMSRIFPRIQELRQQRAEADPEYLNRVDQELAATTINFAIIGLDAGKTTTSGQIIARADAPIILSVNIKTGKVTAIRPPRDLHAPGVDKLTTKYQGAKFRINAMTVFGGSEDARRILEDATGLPVDFGASFSFKGFVQVIDKIGGIDIELDEKFVNRYGDGSGVEGFRDLGIEIKTGINHFDAQAALRYARLRKKDSDYLRGNRQIEVIKAVINKISANPTEGLETILSLLTDPTINIFGSLSYADIAKITAEIMSQEPPSTEQLRQIDFSTFDPWGDLITTGVLEKDKYQSFVKPEEGENRRPDEYKDNKQYWQRLRNAVKGRIIPPGQNLRLTQR